MKTIFESDDGKAFLARGNFENKELIERCIKEIEPLLENNPEIQVFGKICNQQRDIGFFSNDSIGYKYSKKLMESKPLTYHIECLLKEVNIQFNSEFNGILVNKYKNGNDYISAHSDDESDLDNSGVISISFGASRIFRIRDKKTKKIRYNENLESGTIIQMGGDFQKIYTHEIPKQTKIKEVRYSFTFRKHNK